MPGIADAPRNAGEPDFQRGAQGVREDDGRFEAPAQPPRHGERPLRLPRWRSPRPPRAPSARNRRASPARGSVRRRSGRPCLIARTAGTRHDGVAEPVRGADEQRGRAAARWSFRHDHAALVGREEEFRARRLPAVMHPEPIRRLTSGSALRGLRLMRAVSDRPRASRPARGGRSTSRQRPGPSVIDGARQQRGAGAQRHHGGERRGGGEPAEEGPPDAAIAGVLIDQHADTAARAQHCAARP